MSLVLMTREDLDTRALAHYRTPGSKNGVRLYQYKDGSLTPLGRIHYGVGLGRDRSGTSVLIGKKQVNSEGDLTKAGKKKLEETIAKSGSYLNPSKEERDKGMTTERDKVAKEHDKEYWEAVNKGMPTGDPSDKDREIWDKFKDSYAEATLKDLKLPVNERNKGVVKDIFKKYDSQYEYMDGANEEEYTSHKSEIEKNRKERFEKHEKTEKELNESIGEKIKNFNKATQEKKEERAEKNEARNKQLKEELSKIRSLTDMELNDRIARLQKEKQYSELLNERANREKGPVHAMASKLFKEAAERFARKALDQASDEVLKKLLKKGKTGQNDQNDKPKDNKEDSNKPGNPNKPDSGSSDNGGGNKFTKSEKSQIRSMAASGKSIADIASSLGCTEDKVKGFMKSAGITIS